VLSENLVTEANVNYHMNVYIPEPKYPVGSIAIALVISDPIEQSERMIIAESTVITEVNL